EIGTYDDFVLVRDIAFNPHCEHHMMPFIGRAHIAYKPVERVVGLSKLARLVDVYARRLQTQEHMTSQIATAIDEILRPRGVAVMLEAEHMCMSMRGGAKPGSATMTTEVIGSFRERAAAVWRFMSLVPSGHVQRVVEMRTDCDQDAVWIRVEQHGAGACHTGRRSCFYRAVPLGATGPIALEFRDAQPAFDPAAVYGGKQEPSGG